MGNIMWLLNPTSRLPIYKQLMQLVEKNMESGWLAPGERLPSERRLATLLGINRSTVIHALDELVERGILMRKRGSGTYVNSEKWGVQNYALLNWQQGSGKTAAAYQPRPGPFFPARSSLAEALRSIPSLRRRRPTTARR